VRKQNNAHARDYTDLNNLALSWMAGTDYKNVRPNEKVSVDWGRIINQKAIAGQNNVFALYLDLNTGLVFAYPAQSRGLAGPSLLAYIQRYGPPETIISDNAREFTGGEFAEICKKHSITQERSAPYNPNQNPVEHYMENDNILSNTLSPVHLGSRTLNLLESGVRTRCKPTTENGLTRQVHSI
jgi:hypothetical protein